MAAWLYTHPRARRAWLLMQLLWGGCLFALVTAPTAAADTGSVAMGWTGLHDSYGVPIGAHLLATVPLSEAVREQGPDIGINPETWVPALAARSGTAITYTWLSGVLAFESVILVFIVAAGIWFLRFALGGVWLSWLAALARPAITTITATVSQLQLEVGMALICVTIGAVTAVVKGVGRGLGIMFGGVIVVVLTALLLRDPVGAELNDNGVLAIGRSLGFRLSQGVANNGALPGGNTESQLDNLSSWLVDVLVRQQVEVLQFGRVIDDTGCVGLYNSALMTPSTYDSAAAAHAIQSCDAGALAHAQQLSMGTAAQFGLTILVISLIIACICYVGAEVVRIGFKAFFNLLAVVCAAPFAIPPGTPREYTKRTAVKLVVHGIEMVVATAGLGVLVILMANITRGTLPGAVGMTDPTAKLFIMALIAVGGAVGFRHLLRGFGDRGLSPRRTTREARDKGQQAIDGMTDVRRRGRTVRDRLSRTDSTKPGETGEAGSSTTEPNAPRRRAHPAPATAERRPPTAPAGESARPTSTGPGRTPDPSPASTNTKRTVTAATDAAKVAAKTAAAVAAPETVAAKTAVTAVRRAPQVAGTANRGGRSVTPGGAGKAPAAAPGRTTARPAVEQPPPQNRRPTADTTTPTDMRPKAEDVQQQAQHPERPVRRDSPPPGRSGPAPDTSV